MLLITDFTASSAEIAKREAIMLTSRVHPAETVSSFVIEGLIEYLLARTAQADYLRKNFVFKIVPMLNIDGVIVGNTRTAINGLDYNRCWGEST
jgi:murein tripeptide amidase MpaA